MRVLLDRRRLLMQAGALAAAPALASRAGAAAPIRIGFVPVIGAAALIVFAGSRLAKSVGVELALVRLDPAMTTLPAASGGFDAFATGVAPIARARTAGADVRIVASLATAGSGFVAVPALAARFYAAEDDPVAAFAAFRAKTGRPARLATTRAGVVPNVLLQHWLFVRHAVPRDLVELVTMDLTAMPAALVAGRIEGATLPEPLSTIAREATPSLQRITTGADMFPDMPGVVFALNGALVAARPATCRAIVRGLVAATRMIQQSPAEAAPLIAGSLGVPAADEWLVGRALASSNLGFVTDPRAIEASTRKMLAYETQLGDFATMPSTDGLFDESVYGAGH